MSLRGWFYVMVVLQFLEVFLAVCIMLQFGWSRDDVKSKIDSRFNELQFRIDCS